MGGEPGLGRRRRQGAASRRRELFREHVYGCFFDDAFGLRNLDAIGVDNVIYETDYPHSDSTWPHSRKIAEEQMEDLPDDVVYKVVRGNAIEMLPSRPSTTDR